MLYERRWVTCTVVVLLRYVRNNLRRSLIRSPQSLAVPVTGLAPYARVPCPNAKLCAACNNLRNTEYTVIHHNLRNFRPASIDSEEAEKSLGLQRHYFSKLNHQRVIIDDSYPPPVARRPELGWHMVAPLRSSTVIRLSHTVHLHAFPTLPCPGWKTVFQSPGLHCSLFTSLTSADRWLSKTTLILNSATVQISYRRRKLFLLQSLIKK